MSSLFEKISDLSGCIVLNFHGIGAVPSHVGISERPYWAGIQEFGTALDQAIRLSRESDVRVEFTFDDGNKSDIQVALPALRERGLRALFFVCAGRIGESAFLSADDIRELHAAGMGLGSHGWGHVDWRKAGEPDLHLELVQARQVLSDIVGEDLPDVSVPFGSYDRKVLARLRACETRLVYTSGGGLVPGRGRIVPRVSYRCDWSPAAIERVFSRSLSKFDQAKCGAIRLLKSWS